MAKQILLIYYEIVKFTCMKITYNLFLYFKHFSCFRARFVLLVLREVERGGGAGTNYRRPGPDYVAYVPAMNYISTVLQTRRTPSM